MQAQKGDAASAIRAYDSAIASDERNPLPYRMRGNVLYAQGAYEQAGDSLRRALERDRLDAQASEDGILLPAAFFILTVLPRLPLTSKLLYHWDSVQFALALKQYDITLHQPHPPGYFLYVMLGRLLNLFINDANTVFVSISLIFSGLAVAAIYHLGKEISDKKIGIIAAAIALTSPNLWFHGEVALSYIVEAFFSTIIALLCWRILKGEHNTSGFLLLHWALQVV